MGIIGKNSFLVALLLPLSSVLAQGNDNYGFVENRQVGRMFADANTGVVYVGYLGSRQTVNTDCQENSVTFWFNSTTPAGKNQYAALLAAKMTGAFMDFWFSATVKNGTGCQSRLDMVGFQAN